MVMVRSLESIWRVEMTAIIAVTTILNTYHRRCDYEPVAIGVFVDVSLGCWY